MKRGEGLEQGLGGGMPFCPPVYFCESVGTPGEGRLPPVGGTAGLWEMPRRHLRSAKSYGRWRGSCSL